MVCMIVMGVLLTGLVGYANASNMSAKAYRNQRNERYAGDAAIKAAVNWAKDKTNVGRDTTIDASDPACVYDVPTQVGTVTATCAAEAGGGSGEPAEGGLVPPESLLLLGNRKAKDGNQGTAAPDEPGPFNVPDCKGWWDSVRGWFTNGTDPDATGPGEYGAWFRKRTGLGTFSASCDTARTRTDSSFKVKGRVVAAGRIQVDSGMTFQAIDGCRATTTSGNVTCSTIANRAGFTGALAYLNGKSEATDPGRKNPAAPAKDPIGDIAEPFRAVGFKDDGSVQALGYTPTTLMPSMMPNRTRGYFWSAGSSALVPATTTGAIGGPAACGGASATIVFLPGWYQSAEVLNQYTASAAAACTDVTFWFAPDPGPDGQLLTNDDRTGGYYFDFSASPGADQACTGMPVSKVRWCVGNAPGQNARVVGGTPLNWAPLGATATAPAGSPDTRSRIKVTVDNAATVDEDLSQSWAQGVRASKIDGQAAHYHADICFIWCFSSDRAIRVRDFTPKVTSPPIDEPAAGALPAAPKGRIYAEVAYGITNPVSADHAKAEIRAVGAQSGEKPCGTYDLFTNKNDANYATGLHTYRFTDAQAKQLADACGTVDLINGLEVMVRVTGNGINTPTTDVYLDGVRFSYDTFEGANFPNPNGPGPSSAEAAAKTDCDPTKAGAQFIFGGSSNLYSADGSVEICAGAYPTDPENHQAIGVYGVPAVTEVTPTAITGNGGTNNVDPPLNPGNITAIDKNEVTIRYGGCAAFCGSGPEVGWVDMSMGTYSPPTGYAIDKIEARVSYNPKSQGCSILWDCPGLNPQLQFPSAPGTCAGSKNFPKNPEEEGVLQVANIPTAVLYGGSSGACVTPAQLASGVTLRWAARAECNVGVCKLLGGQWSDTIDGISLQITIKPTDTTTAWLRPQGGCITAHPNYNGGSGNPDCAIIRADTNDFADNWSFPWTDKEGQSRGRLSVKGTIYAPSSALEVDDTDDAYPLATRGAVLRHLRVSGWGFRPNYDGTAIGNTVDKTPAPREATFTSCIQTATRRAEAAATRGCSAAKGDKILTRARIRFAVMPAHTVGSTAVPATANIPQTIWWSDDR